MIPPPCLLLPAILFRYYWWLLIFVEVKILVVERCFCLIFSRVSNPRLLSVDLLISSAKFFSSFPKARLVLDWVGLRNMWLAECFLLFAVVCCEWSLFCALFWNVETIILHVWKKHKKTVHKPKRGKLNSTQNVDLFFKNGIQ